MGAILSYFYTEDDDHPLSNNSVTRDNDILKSSWRSITKSANNLETGMAIFINLFTKHPQYHQLFPFRDVPLDQLKTSNKFKAHCINLMAAFTSIIENVDDIEMMKELLLKQGDNHVSRKVPDEAYWHLKEVILDLVSRVMNDKEIQLWTKFLDDGMAVIIKGAQNKRNHASEVM